MGTPWSGPDRTVFCPVNWSSSVSEIYHLFVPLDSIYCRQESNSVIERAEFIQNTNNCTQYKERVMQVWINQTGSSPKDLWDLQKAETLCLIPPPCASKSAAFPHVQYLLYCLVIELTLPLLITALCPFFSFRTSLQYIAWDRIKSTLGDSKASLKILVSIPWKKRILDIEIGRKVQLCTVCLNAPCLFPFTSIFISC